MNIFDITADYLDIKTVYKRCLSHIVEYLDIDPEYPFFSVYVYVYIPTWKKVKM